MMRYLVTLQAPDRKGLVEQIANAVSRQGGNWLDSEMRHIDGIFAAILQLEVPADNWDQLIDSFECIDGLTLTYSKASIAAKPIKQVHYQLVAYDRPGIVLHISNKLSGLGINIEQFSSQYETASHTGVALFKANMHLGLTDTDQEDQIAEQLYQMGDDVVLDKMPSVK
ncbi:glycine cleavage system protein R [Shewanella aestuarii]|uniref:Glycine cleavage system transcriptional repressor n=1 Tax=Shewanella aestuarii TaxID=1028752 RepID=A0A6G9QKJ7_9GAMM|nr:ACT domain-containing protein [Shewanella aestuarii]QIR14908.1 amino acid-binding protein [Shewanella aestuarii]